MPVSANSHARISSNIHALLHAAARQQSCEAFVADLALLGVATGSVFYPDVMVSSDPDEPFVVRHRRAGDFWVHTLHGPEDHLTLDCPDITFQVADLY